MVRKIRREVCLQRYPTFPLRKYNKKEDEEEFYYPIIYQSYILTLRTKSFSGHVKVLGTEMVNMAKAFRTDWLIFLGDTASSWLSNSNDYKRVQLAEEYLAANQVGRRFTGGLQVDRSDLPIFIKHLAWLTRCNAALPYFHFINEEQCIVGTICQYGNLHFDTLTEDADTVLHAFIEKSKFEVGDKNSCHNWFGNRGGIPGRQTNG